MDRERMTEAAQAFEGSLMILRKDKAGWVLGLSVHPDDAPNGILKSPLGTRYHCVMFQIDDDETLIIPEDVRKGKAAVATAGEMCRQDNFQRWLSDRRNLNNHSEKIAAVLLAAELEIDSRSSLRENEQARDRFRELILEYRQESQ